MMPTLVLTPVLVVPARSPSRWQLRPSGPTFPPVFSIYLTAWFCRRRGAIPPVVTPRWGSPSAEEGAVLHTGQVCDSSPNARPTTEN